MRIIYILILCGFIAVTALWLGSFAVIKRKTAALTAAAVLITGGALLAFAVLPGNSFYGATVTDVPTQKKLVALTFDDGPYPPYTNQLLAVLAKKNVQATFFMVGENAFKHQQEVKLAHAQGHEIALHAGKHQDFLKLDADLLAGNIDSGKSTLEWLTGEKIKYIRPPHGFRDWAVMRAAEQAGLTVVNWSVIPRDWTNPGARTIADRVCEAVKPGAIVLLHDGDSPANKAPRSQTIEATAIIIDRLRAEGYEFVTVSRLLAEKEK